MKIPRSYKIDSTLLEDFERFVDDSNKYRSYTHFIEDALREKLEREGRDLKPGTRNQ